MVAPWVTAADDDIAPPVEEEPKVTFSRFGGIGEETVMRRSRRAKPRAELRPNGSDEAVPGNLERGPSRVVRGRERRHPSK